MAPRPLPPAASTSLPTSPCRRRRRFSSSLSCCCFSSCCCCRCCCFCCCCCCCCRRWCCWRGWRAPPEEPRRFRGRPTRARHPRGGDQRSAKNCCYLTPHCMGRLTPARRALFAVAPVVWSPASFAGIAPSATSTCPTASAPRRGPRARRPSPRRRCCAGASRRGRGMRRPTGPLASPPALPRT